MITCLTYGFEVAIIKVSRAPLIVDHTHLIDERRKMAGHSMYIYKLNMPSWEIYVFENVTSVKIPVNLLSLKTTLPKFINDLWLSKE
ncbi:unnamed protein product [Cunninghamella echinulata]